MKILMVCLGNICRSPLAHGIMQHMAYKNGLNWEIDSAGTGGWHMNDAPHELSQKVALENGIDISNQRSRVITPQDFETFDYIFFMDEQNMADSKNIVGSAWQPAKAKLLMDALPNHLIKEVPDPYYGGKDGFYSVFKLITQACNAWITQLK